MLDPLDALDSCSRELTDFQVRAGNLQANTANLIAGTKVALADSRRLMCRIDGDTAMPRKRLLDRGTFSANARNFAVEVESLP